VRYTLQTDAGELPNVQSRGSLPGELRGQAHNGRGTIDGPAVALGDAIKLGVVRETIVDRTAFGLNWNAPLPRGGFAIANDVELTIELELVQG
jgi:hypothetical protein